MYTGKDKDRAGVAPGMPPPPPPPREFAVLWARTRGTILLAVLLLLWLVGGDKLYVSSGGVESRGWGICLVHPRRERLVAVLGANVAGLRGSGGQTALVGGDSTPSAGPMPGRVGACCA